jgi:transposase
MHRLDHETVQEVIADLCTGCQFRRVVFARDRGMVSDENLESITKGKFGFLFGLKRRRNAKFDGWLQAVDETRWIHCRGGINAQERQTDPPRTRAQELPSGIEGMGLIVIDSDQRRAYEQTQRQQAMERARQKLEKLKERIDRGALKQPEKVGAAVERIMQRYHGYRYFDWQLRDGTIAFSEGKSQFEREKRVEGKYVIATSEKALGVTDAAAMHKDLTEVESRFRQLKDVLAMRPIYHQIEPRVRARIFVAALAPLVQRLLGRRLRDTGIDLSPAQAVQALSTIRLVTFRLDGQPERRGVAGGSQGARRVLRALKLRDLQPRTPPDGQETVM